jgi:hypothetical protein
MTDRWNVLCDEITQWRISLNEVAAGRESEGLDGAPEAFARADELGKVLALMKHMEGER